MASTTVPCSAVSKLASLLDTPEIVGLIADLDDSRWTGRPGYPIRSMVGIALAKTLYSIPTWTKIIALVKEHKDLSELIAPDGKVPSVFACYRFTKKLIEYDHLVEKCITKAIQSLGEHNPEFGKNIAIDASDVPAYAKGRKAAEVEEGKCSDPDASWGYRSAVSTRAAGVFFGYKLHMAVCANTGFPLAWRVETAKAQESTFVRSLLDQVQGRDFNPQTCAMDKGYDHAGVHFDCMVRGIAPVVPLRETPDVKRGEDQPTDCEHGVWQFAGADRKRGATKWRCPTGECKPGSEWIKANRLKPLIPHSTARWDKLYKCRTAIEREFGRLKHEWAMLPLRIRSLAKVKLHVDLTILTKLACALIA
jgi:hypothetical protein